MPASLKAVRTVVALLLTVTLLITAPPERADASASGCNGAVCIFLTGTGLTVDRWRTTVNTLGGGYQCRTAEFWRNGSLWRTQSVCGSGVLAANLYNLTFPHNTHLCNRWQGATGNPCARVLR